MNIAFVIPKIDARTARTLQLQAELLRRWGADLQIFTAAAMPELPLSLQVAVRQVAPEANLAADGFFAGADLTVYCYTESHPLLAQLRRQGRGVALLYCMAAVTPSTLADSQGLERLLPYADLVVVGSQTQVQLLREAGFASERLGVLAPVYAGQVERAEIPIDARPQGYPLNKPAVALLALPDDLKGQAVATALAASLPDIEVTALPLTDAPAQAVLAQAVLVVAVEPGPDAALAVLEAMAAGRPVLGVGEGYWEDAVQKAGVTVASPEEAAAVAVELLDENLAGVGRYSSLAAAGRAYAIAHPLQEWALAWHGLLAQAAGWLPLPSVSQMSSGSFPTGNFPSNKSSDDKSQMGVAAKPEPELAQLRAAATVLPQNYQVRSPTPVVGPLIAWVRRQLTAHLRAPYLDPILQKQEHFNRQAVVALEELARQARSLQAQQAARKAELAQRDRALEQQIAQLLGWVEQLQRQQQPDPTIVQAMRQTLLALQQEFQPFDSQEEG